jgi:hypothetical protein
VRKRKNSILNTNNRLFIYRFLFITFLYFSLLHTNAQGRLGILLEDNSVICISTRSGDLYSGIDNYVKIKESIRNEYHNLILKISNGIVQKDTNELFLVIPVRPGRARLTIFNLENEDTLAIGYNYIEVRGVPDPKLMLNNYKINATALLPKSLLMGCDSLSIFFSDDLPGSEMWLRITEFTLGYNYGGFHVSYLNPSNFISLETKEIINRLGPEHEISIRVKVEAEEKLMIELPIYRITLY